MMWTVSSPPVQQCWVIKRRVTGNMYTIRSSEAEDNKRCLMAFKTKGRAQQFKRFVQDMDPTQSKQKLEVEQVPKSSLVQRCAFASLDLFIYEENMTYTTLDEPTDDFRFHLENSYKYY